MVPATASEAAAVVLGEGVGDWEGDPLLGESDCEVVDGELVGPLGGLALPEHALTVSPSAITPAASRRGLRVRLARCSSMISTLGAAGSDVTPRRVSTVSRYRLLP